MNFFDIVSLILITGFLLWGLFKGFILEVSEIAGLILAFILSMYLPLGFNIGGWKYLVSFLIYFFVLSLIFSIISKIVNKTPLALIDKILGGLVGAIKGLIIVIIIHLIIGIMPNTEKYKNLNGSVFYRTSERIKPILKNFLIRRMEDIRTKTKEFPIPENRDKRDRTLI